MDKMNSTLEELKKKATSVTIEDVDYLFTANKSKTVGLFSLIFGKGKSIDYSKPVGLKEFKDVADVFANKRFQELKVDNILSALKINKKPQWLNNYDSFQKSNKRKLLLKLKKIFNSKSKVELSVIEEEIAELFGLDKNDFDFRLLIAKNFDHANYSNLSYNQYFQYNRGERIAFGAELNELILKLTSNEKSIGFSLYYNLKDDYFTMNPEDEFQFNLGKVFLEFKKGKLNSLAYKLSKNNSNAKEIMKEELSNSLSEFVNKAKNKQFNFKNFIHKEVPLSFVSEDSILNGIEKYKLKEIFNLFEKMDEESKVLFFKIISTKFKL